jgi:hypothetical protein
MPWRSVRTFWPPILIASMWKNLRSATFLPSDEHEVVLLEVEQDSVADDVAAVAAGNELLRAIDREVREAVDGEVGRELDGIRPLDVDVDHVVRLIEQHRRLAPRCLLVAPVRELRGHYRVDVGADARVAQKIDWIAGGFEDVL